MSERAQIPGPDTFWRRRAADCVAAVAEVLFPDNDLGAPTWRDTELVARTFAWIEELPPPQQRLVLLMYVAVELAAPLVGPALGRFSRISPARRLAIIRRWRASRVYLVRYVGDSLKSVATMIHLAHPAALEHIGMYKHCDHPHDAFSVRLDPDAGPREHPA